ncbi:tubulin beta-4B chain-like [Xylocopa sonorina]|uniref:tubulin beta-4B chain-like n=1 Tax=Xylocopa sonorina TaxID=1818115 RepID=UPI00403B202B
MREIVQLQVGQCGNNVGTKFWEVISDEHGLSPDGRYQGDSEVQLQRVNVYFTEGPDGRFVPRSVLVDLDPGSLDGVSSGPCGSLFKPGNLVAGRAGAANNWARGYYTEGAELSEIALDRIRAEAEACDLMQGIQMVHSMGGGTGGGMAALLMTRLNEEYPDRIVKTYSVIPSPEMSDVVVEPYNAVFTLSRSIEFTDGTFCIENRAMHRICTRILNLPAATFGDANHLISGCMSAVTACFRFPGRSNADLNKLQVNLVPFPRLHFFVPGYAPLLSRSSAPYTALSVTQLTQRLFHPSTAFVHCEPCSGKYLAVATIFRGGMSNKTVEEQMARLRNKDSPCFVGWIPNNVQTAVCDVAPRGLGQAAGLISNTTAIQEPFERLTNLFDDMSRRKAYVHWYTAEGMDESEFSDSRSMLRDLVTEYQRQQEAMPETSFVEDDSIGYVE